MRRFSQIIILLLAVLIASCSDSSETFLPRTGIWISIDEGNNLTGKADKLQVFTVDIRAEADLSTFEVYKNGQSIYRETLEPVRQKIVVFEYTPEKTEANTVLDFSFVVSDQFGNFQNEDVLLEVLPTELAYTNNSITLRHFHSGSNYAWDLAENTFTSDSAKSDVWLHSVSRQWLAGWESHTSTQFVKVSSQEIDYQTTFLEEIIIAYQAGAKYSQLEGLQSGEVIISKLRGKEAYALIKVASMDAPKGDNSETIQLSYKKVSEFEGR